MGGSHRAGWRCARSARPRLWGRERAARAGAQPLRSAGPGRLRGTRLLATGTMGPEQGTHLPATGTSGAGDGRPGLGCLLKHPGERSGLTAGVATRWPLA